MTEIAQGLAPRKFPSFQEIRESLGGGGGGSLGDETQGFESSAVPAGVESPKTGVGGITPTFGTPTFQGGLSGGLEGSYQGLLQPVAQQQAGLGQQLGQTVSTFEQQAGPPTSFNQAYTSNLLSSATNPSLTPQLQQESKDTLNWLQNLEYTGPQGLDQVDLAKIGGGWNSLLAQSAALKSGGGTMGLLNTGVAGLTPGEARFEAQALRENPAYRAAAVQAHETTKQGAGEVAKEAAKATTMAEQRAKETQYIADQTRKAIEAERDKAQAGLEQRVSEAEAARGVTSDAYQRFMETGDVGVLPPDIAQALQATPGQANYDLAQQVLAEIQGGYPALQQYGIPNLEVTGHGTETLTAPGAEMGGQNLRRWAPEGMTRREAQPIRQDIRAGTRLLEPFFSPGQKRPMDLNASLAALDPATRAAVLSYMATQGIEPGKVTSGIFSSQAPMYFAETPFEQMAAPDARPFVTYQESIPTKESMATEQEAFTINTLNDLLGNMEQIATTEPYKAAMIMADIDGYLSAEEAALEARGKDLGEEAKSWKKTIHKIRKRYRKSKNSLGNLPIDIFKGMGQLVSGSAFT